MQLFTKLTPTSKIFNSNCRIFFTMLLIAVLPVANVSGQASTANYAFAINATGSLAADLNSNAIDMTSGTATLVAAGLDDTPSGINNLNLGGGSTMEFFFMGQRYSQ